MSNTWYDGYVPMTPEMEKREFYSGDDDFTCKVPRMVYKCSGEMNADYEAFEWNNNSIIIAKDGRAIEYVEDTHYELLMTDLEGWTCWESGPVADCMGWDIGDVKEIRKVENRFIEEYDINNMEKRRYRLVLEDVLPIENHERCLLEDAFGEDVSCCDGYTMEVSKYL